MAKLPMIGLAIGVVVVVAIGAVILISGLFLKKGFQSDGQEAGQAQAQQEQRATAKILESRTGSTVGEHTELELLLEVAPPEGEPFQVRLARAVYRLNVDRYRPGATLQVSYGSRSPDSFRLLSEPEGSSPGSGSATDRLEELKNLRDKGLVTQEEFEQKKQEILEDL